MRNGAMSPTRYTSRACHPGLVDVRLKLDAWADRYFAYGNECKQTSFGKNDIEQDRFPVATGSLRTDNRQYLLAAPNAPPSEHRVEETGLLPCQLGLGQGIQPQYLHSAGQRIGHFGTSNTLAQM
jgi:hypothetical protein